MATMLKLRGPLAETHWEIDNSTGTPVANEVVDRYLEDHEARAMALKFHMNVFNKALSFSSDLIQVWAISQSLYEQKQRDAE